MDVRVLIRGADARIVIQKKGKSMLLSKANFLFIQNNRCFLILFFP